MHVAHEVLVSYEVHMPHVSHAVFINVIVGLVVEVASLELAPLVSSHAHLCRVEDVDAGNVKKWRSIWKTATDSRKTVHINLIANLSKFL